jgi:quercetin dioxygenase-like cupin family protein
MKKIISNRKLTLALVLCAITICTVTAYALTNNLLASGTIASSALFNGPATIRMSQLLLNPGDTIPWHYHPGVSYVIVKNGTITEDLGCGGTEVFSAGQAFEETTHSVHQVRNLGTTQAELYVTTIFPVGSSGRIDTGGPLCGPPLTVDQCKNSGWMSFNFPRSFNNQGDCVSFVETGK